MDEKNIESFMKKTWPNYNFYLKTASKKSVPITILRKEDVKTWAKKQTQVIKKYLSTRKFIGKEGQMIAIHETNGEISQILFGIGEGEGDSAFWACGSLPKLLPESCSYFIEDPSCLTLSNIAYVWALGCYEFMEYKTEESKVLDDLPYLVVDKEILKKVQPIVQATYWIRDMINSPPNKLTPKILAHEAAHLRDTYDAYLENIVGEDLLACNYPSVHAVGRASDYDPRIIDLRWGETNHPKITLVGKGVTFDTGGLNIKSSGSMRNMRKDMGGAAHALGFAAIIMAMKLPLQLRILIGAVENAVSGKSFRPSDVINTRKGLSVEIGDTDAEGRIVLCDLLHEASEEKPDLLIDFATLTGAARVALGTDVPAIFSNDDTLARELQDISLACHDPMWHMPIWKAYKPGLKSSLADINSISKDSYGDAIAAAIFLDMFVGKNIPWIHLDFMGWNTFSKPGRPEGGEVLGLRALLVLLNKKFDLKLDLI